MELDSHRELGSSFPTPMMVAFLQVCLVVLLAIAVNGVNQLKGKVIIPTDADQSFVTTTKVLLDGGQYVVRCAR